MQCHDLQDIYEQRKTLYYFLDERKEDVYRFQFETVVARGNAVKKGRSRESTTLGEEQSRKYKATNRRPVKVRKSARCCSALISAKRKGKGLCAKVIIRAVFRHPAGGRGKTKTSPLPASRYSLIQT